MPAPATEVRIGVDDRLGGFEHAERLSVLGAGDVAVIDVELLEDRLVQGSAEVGPGLAVERLGVVEELQRSVDQRGADLELVVASVELRLERRPLGREHAEPIPDLHRREVAVRSEVEEVALLAVDLREPLLDLVPHQLRRQRLVLQYVGHRGADTRGELRREADGAVVTDDRVLDLIDLGVTSGAVVVLLPTAEEVVVLAPVADRALDQETRLAAIVVATPAPNRALEVVRVLTEPLARGRPRGEHTLDLLEQLLADERLVPTFVELPVVDDHAAVVRVTQHRLELRRRHRAGRVAARPTDESSFCEHCLEMVDAVLAGGVQLEGHRHEAAPFRVNRNGTDLATVDALARIQVAQGCAAERSALARLLPHLESDVRPVALRAELVQRGEHAHEHLALGRIVDVLRRRDERDVALAQRQQRRRALGPVAVHA